MKKSDHFFDGKKKAIKNAKITKRYHVYKGYSSTYNAKILNSFDTESQLIDTESAIRNKLKD